MQWSILSINVSGENIIKMTKSTPNETELSPGVVPIIEDELRQWKVVIGTITATHGLKGFVRISPRTQLDVRFSPGSVLCLVSPMERRKLVTIEKSFKRGPVWVAQFEGFESIDDAEETRDWELTVIEDIRPELKNDEFLVNDIIGLNVVTTDGTDLGKISDVMNLPANDVYVIDTGLIPATKEVVKQIDLSGNRMVITPISGLFDRANEQ